MHDFTDLNLLKEIYRPSFELAWGWWLVLTTLLTIAVVLITALVYWHAKRKYRRISLRLLRHSYSAAKGDVLTQLNNINGILKFTAIKAYPHKNIASLSSTQWLDFLDVSWRSKPKISFTTYTQLLVISAYQRHNKIDSKQIAALYQLTQLWIKQHKPKI